jgi:hypothetical protein
MAQFTHQFLSQSQRQDKSQPRRLAHWAPSQQCSWTGCIAKATNEHKDQVYCANHLLKALQKQWQE